MTQRRPTLREVAAYAAVSKQTVSNAINAPHRLEPATLARVVKAIDELQYRPSRIARSLSTGSAGLIGYCMARRPDDSASSMMDEFLHALSTAMESVGRHVLLFTAQPGEPGLHVYADLIAQQAVDAFVLSDTELDDPRHRWLNTQDIQFVSFGRTHFGAGPELGPWVDVDGAAACARLVDGLRALGHGRIGFIGWSDRLAAAEDRRRGWWEACKRHGLPTRGLSVTATEDRVAAGERAAHALLGRVKPPTAIMAASDVLALGVLRAVTSRGARPGTDVAVTGFDDSPLASAVTPGLTSVRQPVAEIAATALRLLHAPGDAVEGILLPATIIARASADITTTLLKKDGQENTT